MQNFFKNQEYKFLLSQTYSLKTSNYSQIRTNVCHLTQVFPQALVGVSQSLFQILDPVAKTFDVPEFPRLKTVVCQPDLLVTIPLAEALTTQRIQLKFLLQNFSLIDSVFTYQSSFQPGQDIENLNGGTYCFFLHFLNSFAHLSEQELQHSQEIRQSKEADLSSYQVLNQRMLNDQVQIGFQTQLEDFQIYIRKIFNCFDAVEDELIQFQQLIQGGLFYCPSAEQLKIKAKPQEEFQLEVKKAGKLWPPKEEEEPEEPEADNIQEEEVQKEAPEEQKENEQEEEAELDDKESVQGKDLEETQKIQLENEIEQPGESVELKELKEEINEGEIKDDQGENEAEDEGKGEEKGEDNEQEGEGEGAM